MGDQRLKTLTTYKGNFSYSSTVQTRTPEILCLGFTHKLLDQKYCRQAQNDHKTEDQTKYAENMRIKLNYYF
jgi:hypothetical protein